MSEIIVHVAMLLYRLCDCAGVVVDVKIESHVGLTVSRCSFQWTSDNPGRVMLRLRAIPTASSRSRILAIKFHTNATSDVPGIVCPWLVYELPDIRVINNFTATTAVTDTTTTQVDQPSTLRGTVK